jgi:ADP-heptose:LPS heptosyltransferase
VISPEAPVRDVPAQRRFSQQLRLVLLRGAGAFYRPACGALAPDSVLLIRPDHLGDVLFLTPAVHALRQALPEARLTLLVGPWSAEVVAGNKDFDAVALCSFPGFERKTRGNALAPYRLLSKAAGELRGRFDTAVVLRFDHWWGAWLAAAAGIPRRIGYAWPETHPFLTEMLPYRTGRHEVQQNATLLEALAPGMEAALGQLQYAVQPEDRAWAAERMREMGRPLVAIHPGAGAAVKQWPVANWAAVGQSLVRAKDASIVLSGGPGERSLSAGVAGKMQAPALDLAGQTTLGQLAAIYERCDLVLGSDSGPLHLAVAVGAATVHLFGPVPATKFGPWGPPARNVVLESPFVCAPCDRLDWSNAALPLHGCMAGISPDCVIETALRLLSE